VDRGSAAGGVADERLNDGSGHSSGHTMPQATTLRARGKKHQATGTGTGGVTGGNMFGVAGSGSEVNSTHSRRSRSSLASFTSSAAQSLVKQQHQHQQLINSVGGTFDRPNYQTPAQQHHARLLQHMNTGSMMMTGGGGWTNSVITGEFGSNAPIVSEGGHFEIFPNVAIAGTTSSSKASSSQTGGGNNTAATGPFRSTQMLPKSTQMSTANQSSSIDTGDLEGGSRSATSRRGGDKASQSGGTGGSVIHEQMHPVLEESDGYYGGQEHIGEGGEEDDEDLIEEEEVSVNDTEDEMDEDADLNEMGDSFYAAEDNVEALVNFKRTIAKEMGAVFTKRENALQFMANNSIRTQRPLEFTNSLRLK
jgi:hypothetical protein